MTADPWTPSEVAVIVAEPGPIASTRPDGVTAAIDVSWLSQVTVRKESSAPLSLLAVAPS